MIRLPVVLVVGMWCSFNAHAGFFSSTYGDFKELVEAGDKSAAALFLEREAAYFDKLEGAKRAYVDAFRRSYLVDQFAALVTAEQDPQALEFNASRSLQLEALDVETSVRYRGLLATLDKRQAEELRRLLTQLDAAGNTAAPIKRWSLLKTELRNTHTELQRQQSVNARPEQMTRTAAILEAKRDLLIDKLKAEAGPAIASYGWFSQPSFAEVYPISVDIPELLANNADLMPQLEAASTAKIKRFHQMYRSEMPSVTRQKVSSIYLGRLAAERGAKSYLDKRRLVEEARQDGFEAGEGRVMLAAWPLSATQDQALSMVPPTNATLAELGPDQTPSDFLATPEVRQYDLIVFMRVLDAKTEQSEKSRQTLASRYRSGTRTVSNPRYQEALSAVEKAQSDFDYAQSMGSVTSSGNDSSTLGLAISLLSTVSDSMAKSTLEKAQSTFASTPRTLEEPAFQNYTYVQRVQRVSRSHTIKFAVYDPGTGETLTDELGRSANKEFTLVEGVRADDADQAALTRNVSSEQEIRRYISVPIQDRYDDVWQAVFEKYQQKMLAGGQS